MNFRAILVFSFLGLLSLSAHGQINLEKMIRNFHVVETGHIYRGAQPSDKAIEALAQAGVHTILNLRGENPVAAHHEAQVAKKWGMRSINIPMSTVLVPSDKQVNFIENKLLTDTTLYPIFVHCLFGEDRTGLVVALYRVKTKMPAWAAYFEWVEIGFHTYLFNLSEYFFKKVKGS